MINPTIDEYTKKVDTWMAKYPTFTLHDKMKELEAKTGQPAPYFFVVAVASMASLISIMGGMKLLVDLVAFVCPAYMSLQSLESQSDNTQWLKYWVVFSLYCIFEKLLFFVTLMIPMYQFLKLGIVVWMFHSSTKGAQTIYEILLPLIKPHLEKFSKAE